MPRVRYTADGGHYRVGGYGFDPGDERGVDDDLAEYLAGLEDFEVLDAGGTDDVEEDDTGEDDVEEDEDETFAFDPGDATDFEANGWLDNDYRDRAEAVRAGGLDEFLDEIEAAETSDTVIEAIQERRDELEG